MVLLIMVVAVSYIQAVLRQTKADNSFQLGRRSNQTEILALQSATDSLKTRLGRQEVIHAESLLQRDKLLQKNVDSLSGIIGAQEQTLIKIKKNAATVKPAAAQNPVDTEKRHRELLAYYTKKYESLPADLTEYERKIAISEIRLETAAKYSLSLAEFNRIRESQKFKY